MENLLLRSTRKLHIGYDEEELRFGQLEALTLRTSQFASLDLGQIMI